MYCEHYGVNSGFNLLFVNLIVLNSSINICNFMLYKNSYVFVIYLRTVNGGTLQQVFCLNFKHCNPEVFLFFNQINNLNYQLPIKPESSG